MNTIVRPKTVRLIGKFLHPLADEGLITIPELREILANMKRLAEKGELMPPMTPRLINQAEAAEMLGISVANLKRFEREKRLPFPRRMIGASVRYRNLDVLAFIMSRDETPLE